MKLSQLLAGFNAYRMGQVNQADVSGISIDSRDVKPGVVFVAIRGSQSDGHQFVEQAIGAGAMALVVEDASSIPGDYSGAVVIVDDTRSALVKLASLWFGAPADDLFCIGVTGTNGKTTTTYLIEQVLKEFGWPTGVLGTIDHHLGNRSWDSSLTTPDAITLQRRLADFRSLQAKAAVFEVSSHAIDQKRADGVPFDVCVFTNLTHDHLDYHGTMENYFAAKARLFTEMLPKSPKIHKRSVINIDDDWGEKLVSMCPGEVWSIGQSERATIQFEIKEQSVAGSSFLVRSPMGNADVYVQMPGLHNVYNSVCAVAVGLSTGASLTRIVDSLRRFTGVPGRLQRVTPDNSKSAHAFVDYAHTPDALERALRSLKDSIGQSSRPGKLICVFGCGGDRDGAKRPEMGRIAAEFSDEVIVTSDNPRTEPPQKIIDDILLGIQPEFRHKLLAVEADRRTAIGISLQKSDESDVILIAGKGHEDYQIVGHEKLHFSDTLVVEEWLQIN